MSASDKQERVVTEKITMSYRGGTAFPGRNSSIVVENFDSVVYPTSADQNAAIAIIMVFPAVALLVVGTRVAGRVSTRQFGWGEQ